MVKRVENLSKNKYVKFIFLVIIGIWNIFSVFFLIPLFTAYILGNVFLEENIIYSDIILNLILLVVLCIVPIVILFKKLKEYTIKHFFTIVSILIVCYLWIIFM